MTRIVEFSWCERGACWEFSGELRARTRGNGEKTSGREQTGRWKKTRWVIFERFISVLFQAARSLFPRTAGVGSGILD